jgi:tetratricopeptide (TPR) repeat protein
VSPPGRNDPCPCGSGAKYKHCCGRVGAPAPRRAPSGAAAEHVNLGNALARQGRLEEASASYERALALDADLAEAHNNLGTVLLERGRREQALKRYQLAIAASAGYAEAHENLGGVLLELGRTDEAIASYRRALEIRPHSVDARHQLANALAALGRIGEALIEYRLVLGLAPDSAEVHNNMGSLLRGCGRLEEAVACFGRAIELAPDLAEAHANMGLARRLQSRPREAQTSCLRALELKPDFVPALTTLAECHADAGDFASAERSFRRAAAVDPDSPDPWAGMSRLRRMSPSDAHWLVEAQRIAALPLPARKEASLRYAMGKYFDDVGEFERAFEQFQRANELSKQIRPAHDPEAMTRAVDEIIATEDREALDRVRCTPKGSERAVFIVGMLRSGTTLAEQILASHPEIAGAGELRFWSTAATAVRAAPDDPTRRLRLESHAAEYLGMLESRWAGAGRVVDKMPANVLSLGLIHAALPNARVIHLRRHPLDTCLSIYFQQFETAMSYTNDLVHLARYYGDYVRIMGHWRSVLPPETILDVPYEALAEDPEAWSRRMIRHVGLPWDSRCLEPHLNSRTVITASKWQVRQPITTAGVGRWRNYRRHVGPLIDLQAGD